MTLNQTYPCGDCGQPCKVGQYHDVTSCALWRTRNTGFHSDPLSRDASILRDHVLTLEPERRVDNEVNNG